MIEFEIPIATVSESNRRGHWRKHATRHKQQRAIAKAFTRSWCDAGMKHATFGWTITLVRLSPRLLDDDNLQGALKHVRDGIADAIGINDRKGEWRYRQLKRKQPGVLVEIDAVRMTNRVPAELGQGIGGAIMTPQEIATKLLEYFGPDGKRWGPNLDHCIMATSVRLIHNRNERLAFYNAINRIVRPRFGLSEWNDSSVWPTVKAALERVATLHNPLPRMEAT